MRTWRVYGRVSEPFIPHSTSGRYSAEPAPCFVVRPKRDFSVFSDRGLCAGCNVGFPAGEVERVDMQKLLMAIICAALSIYFFEIALEQLCKLSPRLKKWWSSND